MSLIPDVAVMAKRVQPDYCIVIQVSQKEKKNNCKNLSVETASAAIILSFVEVMQEYFGMCF